MRYKLSMIGVVLLVMGSAQAQDPSAGRAVYDMQCAPCHATGILGSPRTGDTAVWTQRMSGGINSLYASAINGKGGMPARGGNATLSDAQVMAAVNYMLNVPAAGAAAAKPAASTADAGKGRTVYQASCAACHATGAAGAPKLGDGADWKPRLGAGAGALQASALKGKGAMPPKGGAAAASDAEIKVAVDYMVASVK